MKTPDFTSYNRLTLENLEKGQRGGKSDWNWPDGSDKLLMFISIPDLSGSIARMHYQLYLTFPTGKSQKQNGNDNFELLDQCYIEYVVQALMMLFVKPRELLNYCFVLKRKSNIIENLDSNRVSMGRKHPRSNKW